MGTGSSRTVSPFAGKDPLPRGVQSAGLLASPDLRPAFPARLHKGSAGQWHRGAAYFPASSKGQAGPGFQRRVHSGFAPDARFVSSRRTD